MLFISLPIMLYMVYVRNVSAHVRIVRVKMSHATEVEKRLESGLKETDKLSAIILQNQIELFSKLRFSQSISQFCMQQS